MQKHVFIFAVALLSMPLMQAAVEVRQRDIDKTCLAGQFLLDKDNSETACTLGNADETDIYQQRVLSGTVA